MLGRPAPARLGAVVVGPDQLVQEAVAAEQVVQQQLHVVGLARVEVHVQRAGLVQQPPRLPQPRLEEAEVVVEAVVVGRARRAAACGSGARRTPCGRRRRRPPSAGAPVLAAAGVERRIDVDQLEAPVGELAPAGQVVAEQDLIAVHAASLRPAAGGSQSPRPSLRRIWSLVGRRTCVTQPIFSQAADHEAGDVELRLAQAVEGRGREHVVVVVPRLAQRRAAPAPSCSWTGRRRGTACGRSSGRSS